MYIVKVQRDYTSQWIPYFESESLEECREYVKAEKKYVNINYSFKIVRKK